MDAGIISALALLESEPENADALATLSSLIDGGGNGRGKEAAADTGVRRALTEARRVHKERGDWELTARLIDLELGWETDKERRADLYLEKGKILSDELLREDEAVRCYERVLELRPDDEAAEDAVGHISLVKDNWQKIVKKYLEEAKDSTDRQLTTSLYLSIAEIYAKYQPSGEGGDHVEAYLQQALEVEPRNARASMRLERLYRGEQRWEELCELYESRIEAAATKEERVGAYLMLAEVQAKQRGQRAEAAESYKKALGIDPANQKALRALVDFYTAEENWQALIRVYENALRARPRGEPETGMYLQIGMLWWKKLANLESADEYWKRVRKAEPAHPAMLEFYRELHAKEPQKLLAVLQQAQKVEADAKRRLDLGVEMASLSARSSGGVEKAIDLWKGVLKLDPTQGQAIDALKKLYEQTEKWNALLELLKDRLEALPKDAVDERVERLLEVVAIYRDKLNLDVMVINTYNNILQLKPDHTGALNALGAKYEAMGRWNDLIGVLQRTADVLTDNDEKAGLLRRIATLWIDKFGNFNQAVKPLEELYAISPVDPETVARLRDIYTRRRSWRALIDLERKELERLSTPQQAPARREKLMEIARLAADRLGDAREAIALWNKLLELNESDLEALGALAALYEREKRWLALCECLRRQSLLASDPKAQVILLERIGTLYAEKLASPEQAISAYQEIVRKMPSHPKAMRTLRELFAQGQRFDELEKLYGENGQWEELCEVLLGAAERITEAPRKIALYSRVAEIALTQLKAPDRAAKAYERILAADGENQAAAAALVPIYRAAEKWARLLACYEILLAHAGELDAKLGIHADIIKLAEEKLGSHGLAFTWCAKAYALKPSDSRIEKELERLAAEAEAWEELVDIYVAEVARETDPEKQAERHRQLGRISVSRLHKTDDARRHFEAVLERKPDDEEALSTLEQIFTQSAAYPSLLAIYKRREGRAKDPQRRLEMLFKIAWIEEEQLKDLPAAIGTFKKILDTDGQPATQLRTLRALEKLYAGRSEWAELANVLEKQLALIGGNDLDSKVALEHQLGELYETRLDKRHQALDHYQSAFALMPSNKPTVGALERWLLAVPKAKAEDTKDRVDVANLLLPVYEQRDDAKRMVECLDIQLEATTDEARQLELLRRLGELVGTRLGDAKRAYELTGRVFTLKPADGENRRAMATLADTLECPDDLAVRYGKAEEVAAKAGDQDLARDLAWDLGQLFDARLQMPDEAEQAYLRVLDRDAENPDAYVALVQLYSVNERWAQLRTLLAKKKARALDSAGRLSVLFQISDLDEGVLGADDAAVADYLEILEIDPSSHRAFRSLDRLYTSAEKWKELDGLLEKRVPHAAQTPDSMGTPDSRAHLNYRRGDLHANRLDDPNGAADLYEAALADEPRHEAARKGLEMLMKRPELRQRIAKALEPLYVADDAWSKLALVIGAQREAAEGRDAAALAGRLAELQEEKLGARQLALATWREALRLDPGDKKVRDNVERLAQLLGRLPDLAAAWEEAVLASDPADLTLRGELLEKVAELYEYELKDTERARVAWKRLLELDPTNLHTSRPAAAALARLHEAQENWPELIEVLHRQAEWTEKLPERKELLFRIGRIQEGLTVDPVAAVRTYREVLEADGEDREALDSLERLHQAQREWTDLVDVLRRRLELEKDGGVRRDLLWRIAGLNERELKDSSEAVTGYHAILDERPDDQPSLEALARLYEAAERPADLLEILERQLQLGDKQGPRPLDVRMRIAVILDGFKRYDQALERYREVLAEEPRHEGARAGLEKLLDDEDLRLRAAEVLEPHYEKAGEIEKLIRLSELWARYAPDPRERINRLGRIAELREQGASASGAFDALSRAARFAVGEPDLPQLLDRLERVAVMAGQGTNVRTELVALYRELGPDILDATTQERVYLTVAAESHKLGDRATAREYYRRVIDTTPDHPKALDALEQIYLEGREWEPLFEVYARRAELFTGDDDKRRHYLMLLAELCERELDRASEAMRAYEQVLELFPADLEAFRSLEKHYASTHRSADLAELLEKRLTFADDLDEAVSLRFRLATLYDEDLQDSDRAVDNYRATLGGDPTHEGAIHALEKFLDDDAQRVSAAEVLEPIYAARHDWPRLVRIYQIRLEAADDPKVRLGLTKRIARLYEEQLEDLEGAFTWFGKVFREDPADRAMRDQLARLAGILGAWEKLARVYEDYLTDVVGEEGPIAVEILRTLASVYHARLENVDGAKSCYKRLIALDANDEVAFHNLEQLLTRAHRWQDLLETYRESAEGALDLERKKTLLFKQAAIQENELKEVDPAIDLYRAILDVDSEDPRAVAALDRLYTDGKRWHDLVELLVRRLEQAEGPGWIALELRLGAVYEAELEDRPGAIDAYEQVLQRAAGHPDAVRSLERLIVDHEHTFRIAQILEPIYRAEDAWQKLVVIYDAELEFIDDKPKRVELLREIARIHEQRGGDGRLAFQALARAWTEEAGEDGSDRETALYLELVRLSRVLVMWRELVSTLEGAVEKSYDAELQARVHSRIAELKEAHLADPLGAIESWRKVTGVRDDDDDAWKALERLYEQEKRQPELVSVLEKRGSLVSDVGEQKSLAYRAAAIYESALGQPDQAIATWRQVLTLDEDDRAALDALERLYLEKKAFRDLAGVYARKIELTSDEAARRPLRFSLAKVNETELHDTFAAIDAYKGALSVNGEDREALEAIARLYEGERLWADHLEALDALVPLAAGQARIDLELRAAEVVEKQLGDVEAAIGRYDKVLRMHPAARVALERLARDEATRTQAADVLEPYYQERNEQPALIELAELRLSAESEPAARRALLSRIARLSEEGLGDPQAAFAVWGRVLGEDAGDRGAQEELERIAEATNTPAELARLYEERMSAAYDQDVQRALAWKLGMLYENRLGDDDKATRAYNKALELPAPEGHSGGDAVSERDVLEALDRLLTRSGRWRDLGEILEKEAQVAPEPDAQAEFFHRLGVLRAGELLDLDAGLAAFRDALARAAAHAGARAGLEKLLSSTVHAEAALDILEPLYESDGDHEKLVSLSEVRLGITEHRSEQVALLERIAERCEKSLGDTVRALDAMSRAAMLDPAETRLLDEVERLAREAGAESMAGEIFEKVLENGVASEIGREVGLRAARLWERAQDLRAEARYRAVLQLDGENGEALEALDRIYRVKGDAAQLAEILARRAELELDVTQKKLQLAEAARLYESSLGDQTRAIETWRKVIDTDEADHAALDALARLYESAGRYPELVATLTEKARFEEDHGAQVGLKSRVAAIWAERLNDLDKAVEAYRDLLDLAPDSLAGLEALEELERRRQNWTAVQEVLVRRLNAVGAGAAQIPVYRQLAQLAVEKNDAPEDAIGYLHEVLAIAPPESSDAAQANHELGALLERTGKFHDLIDVLTQQANARSQAGDQAGEVRLLVRAADLWEQKLGSPDSATEILERILERDPSNVRALTSLARIYEGAHDLEKCRATLEKAIALASEPTEKAELYFRIGKLEGDANGDDAAEPFYVQALEADYHHAAAALALEKLARAKGNWAKVADLLSRREDSTPDADKRALYLELANVLVEKLRQAGSALPYLERALAISPDDPVVLEPLADLYFQANRLDDALPLYRSLAERMQKARRMKDVGRLRFRIGAIAEKRGDSKLALEEYAAAHQIDPAHAQTLESLGRLHLAAGDWEKARGIYRKMLLQNLDPAAGVTKADVYLHLGEIHEKLGEAPKAIGMYERGLELDGAHKALREALARSKH